MGILNDLANTATGAVDTALTTAGNVIQNPGGAIDYAGNVVGNVLRDPDGTIKGAARYAAENPGRVLPAAVMAMAKKGGKVTVSKASKRADGIAQRGKTRGKIY